MTFARRSLKTLPNLPPSPFDRRYGRCRTKKARSRHAPVHLYPSQRVEPRPRPRWTGPTFFLVLVPNDAGETSWVEWQGEATWIQHAHQALCHHHHHHPAFQHASDAEHVESWFRIPQCGCRGTDGNLQSAAWWSGNTSAVSRRTIHNAAGFVYCTTSQRMTILDDNTIKIDWPMWDVPLVLVKHMGHPA
ncbi:hypothetical protein DFH06DRAFT_1118530 [Mycena polygramma]|nr:hypothetical protein DFH06DRAFT_1118530 [Mycena polygramma]